MSKYPSPHLKAAGWYLDCSFRFVSTVEEAFHTDLIKRASIEMIDLEELEEP